MQIAADILLFIPTSLVLSITTLCLLLQYNARDRYSLQFLRVLIPLCLQLVLLMFTSYLQQMLSPTQLASHCWELFCLWNTLTSILLTSLIIVTMSRYLIELLPTEESRKHVANLIVVVVGIVFMLLSIFLVIITSSGWEDAMQQTLRWHLFAASVLMGAHGVTGFVYRRKAEGWEQENLLKGMTLTFLSPLVLLPLDLIFFRNYYFKLAYLSYGVFAVLLYMSIARRYFGIAQQSPQPEGLSAALLDEKGVSVREVEILELLVQGRSTREIAAQLYISANTVKTHTRNIYAKLGVSNRVQLFNLMGNAPKL